MEKLIESNELKYSIKYMTDEDIDMAVELEKESFSDPWNSGHFFFELHEMKSLMLVAKKESELLGMICISTVLDEASLDTVSVFEGYRRKKIAENLLGTAISLLKERKISSITLEVRRSNAPAIALYESFGFKFEGYRPNYYSKPTEDAAIYWIRDLDARISEEKKCGAGRSDFLSERLSEHRRSNTGGEKCGTWMFRFFE